MTMMICDIILINQILPYLSNMKIIITENKIESAIFKYLNTHYNVDEIHSNPYHDNQGSPTDQAIEYYIGDYLDDERVFYLYNKSFWVRSDDHRKELSPILEIEDDKLYDNLNSMFGKHWEPAFKKWFEYNFGKKIKTINYNGR
jgi:hypothetical protein